MRVLVLKSELTLMAVIQSATHIVDKKYSIQ